MYDLQSEMSTFYKDHVRLSDDKQDELANYKRKNVERLEAGLVKLGYSKPVRVCEQGSYAMSTMVQRLENDYDIDVAVIFATSDLPSSPLGARQRVLEGIVAGGGNFKEDPEARTNAVTVWYQEGYHVDLAVHRTSKNYLGNDMIEHAGVEWCPRDPVAITDWFNSVVINKSPQKVNGATVEGEQLRRIVQLLKFFAKSRSSWKLPGGLLISVLVSECYIPDWNRDEVALYKTMRAIQNRLQYNLYIYNPIDASQELTYKGEYINQVKQFEEKLDDAIECLQPLFNAQCDLLSAVRAWRGIFNHEFWANCEGEALRAAVASNSVFITSTGAVSIQRPSEPYIQPPPQKFYGED